MNWLYHLNLNWEQTFESKTAVGSPGQFAGTFAGLYKYGVQPFLSIHSLEVNSVRVIVNHRHRQVRAIVTNATTVYQTCLRTPRQVCNRTAAGRTAYIDHHRVIPTQ